MGFFKSLFGDRNSKSNPINFPAENNVEQLNIKAKSKIVVGLPINDPPKQLVDAIKSMALEFGGINEIYLFSKKTEGSPVEPVITIGVLFEAKTNETEIHQVMNSIASLIGQNIPEGEVMDIIVLKRSGLFDSIRAFTESLIYKK